MCCFVMTNMCSHSHVTCWIWALMCRMPSNQPQYRTMIKEKTKYIRFLHQSLGIYVHNGNYMKRNSQPSVIKAMILSRTLSSKNSSHCDWIVSIHDDFRGQTLFIRRNSSLLVFNDLPWRAYMTPALSTQIQSGCIGPHETVLRWFPRKEIQMYSVFGSRTVVMVYCSDDLLRSIQRNLPSAALTCSSSLSTEKTTHCTKMGYSTPVLCLRLGYLLERTNVHH